MSNLLIPYLIICLSSLICVILGCKLLHPKYPICIILFYLGYVAFFLGRLYEISRMVLDVELYNSFIITFIGIIGSFSFWLSSNFAIRQTINIKSKKADIIKCLILSIIISLSYIIMFNGTTNGLERIIELIVTIYVASNVFYHTKHLLLIKEDKTKFLKNIKSYNVMGLYFNILIILFAISFAYSNTTFLSIISILLSINMIFMLLAFMKGVKEWK